MKEIKKIKPLFNRIVTTMNVYKEDQKVGVLIDPTKKQGAVDDFQTVIAVGTTVSHIKVGDVVHIDPTRYMYVEHSNKHNDSLRKDIVGDQIETKYRLPIHIINNQPHLLLFDSDIDYIVEEFEDIEDPTGPTLIVPEAPKLIVD